MVNPFDISQMGMGGCHRVEKPGTNIDEDSGISRNGDRPRPMVGTRCGDRNLPGDAGETGDRSARSR